MFIVLLLLLLCQDLFHPELSARGCYRLVSDGFWWFPGGILVDSWWFPGGFLVVSLWILSGFRKGFRWAPSGLQVVSGWRVQNPSPLYVISVFKASLIYLQQLQIKVFKNSTAFSKHDLIFRNMFLSLVFPNLSKTALLCSLSSKLTETNQL